MAWHARHYCRAVYAFPDFKHLITDGALLYKKVEGKVVDVEELSVQCVHPLYHADCFPTSFPFSNQVIFYAYSYLVDNEELFDSLWAGEGKETDDQAFEKNCQLVSSPSTTHATCQLTSTTSRCRMPPSKHAEMIHTC